MTNKILVLAIFSVFSVLGFNVLKNTSATKELAKAQLKYSGATQSAFNDESLHAGVGGTWSGAGPIGGKR